MKRGVGLVENDGEVVRNEVGRFGCGEREEMDMMKRDRVRSKRGVMFIEGRNGFGNESVGGRGLRKKRGDLRLG